MSDTEVLTAPGPAAPEVTPDRDAQVEALRQSLAVMAPDEATMGHKPFTGRHSHEHSAMGSQGDDKVHTHSHSHVQSGAHDHPHGAAAWPVSPFAHLGETERRRVDGDNEVTDPDALSAMVAAAIGRFSSEPIVAATKPDGTTVGLAWHGYLCAEGMRTDDGRELLVGACSFPDLPVSLRILLEDSGGHYGAVTCGLIATMERQEVDGVAMIYATGVFGSDPNGQLAELMVTEQTQRFISIDPRDVEGEWITVTVSTGDGIDDDYFVDEWLRISSCTIGAATIVAMPALPQAVITLADVALPDAPIAKASAPPSLAPALVAAGGVAVPKIDCFANPGFYLGDPRLIRQPSGGAACPSTVSDDGTRCWGHLAEWQTTHTGAVDEHGRPVKPPRSRTNYANFLTGYVVCDDGTTVPVGNLTFGCGHATTRPGTSLSDVIAHYDGGYGAVVMADVAVGEDDFGIWFAGAMRPGLTDEQLRAFRATNLSGDWRLLGGNLELVAVLAGVPSPGFPISRRALTAAGTPIYADGEATIATMEGGRCTALVAAGRVIRTDPLARIAHLEGLIEGLTVRLDVAERASTLDRLRAGLAV